MTRKPILLPSEKSIPRSARRVNTVPIAHEELFVVRNPKLKGQPFKNLRAWKDFLKEIAGREQWIYWPSENIAVRTLDEELYFEVRTARNKNLITKEEQAAYRNFKVGIGGLSIGSSVVSALVLTGGPKNIKLADLDTLDPTNMNRVRAGIADVGSKKLDLVAREVWKVDPFANLTLFPKGLTEQNIEDFILGKPRLDVVIDEMDNFAMKVMIREVARRERIPVLMATDYADSTLIDVERFDLEPKRKLFHGLAGNITSKSMRNVKGKKWLAMVGKIIGGPYMPTRLRASLGEVGNTLAGVPQLGTDALAAGIAISLAVRKIAAGAPLPSGRYMHNMEKVLTERIVK